MVLLDTNVISEVLQPEPAPSVRRWMERQSAEALFTTSVCEAEIMLGAALLPRGRRRRALEEAIAAIFREALKERVLPFDRAAARAYAAIGAERRRIGRPVATPDVQIAAIAHSRGAAVATRNVADFADCGIDVIDPWSA